MMRMATAPVLSAVLLTVSGAVGLAWGLDGVSGLDITTMWEMGLVGVIFSLAAIGFTGILLAVKNTGNGAWRWGVFLLWFLPSLMAGFPIGNIVGNKIWESGKGWKLFGNHEARLLHVSADTLAKSQFGLRILKSCGRDIRVKVIDSGRNGYGMFLCNKKSFFGETMVGLISRDGMKMLDDKAYPDSGESPGNNSMRKCRSLPGSSYIITTWLKMDRDFCSLWQPTPDA